MRALTAAFLERQLADGLLGNDSLLGGADRAVVKGLPRKDIGHGFAHVGCSLDVGGHVARAHAVRRLAGAVRRAHKARAAGCQDHADVAVPHQLLRSLERGVRHAIDQALGRTDAQRCTAHHVGRFANAADRRRVRAQDDGVAGLDGNQRLVDRRRSRIRGRNHRGDDAYRRGDFEDALFFVLAQDSHGAHAADGAVHVHRAQAVLDDLVGDVAVAGLFHRQPRERLRGSRGCFGAGVHNGVHLLLGKCGKFFLGFDGAGNRFPRFLNGDEVAVAQTQALNLFHPNARRAGGPNPTAYFFAPGRIFSTCSCGRGITCTATNSPTRLAAAAPASTAAFTAPTSPRTVTVTYPEPIYSLPVRTTLAALTMASEASIAPTKPLVSIIPNASLAMRSSLACRSAADRRDETSTACEGESRRGAETVEIAGEVLRQRPAQTSDRTPMLAAATPLRVEFFTKYMASSALCNRSTLVCESVGYVATPTLAVIFTLSPSDSSQVTSRVILCKRRATRQAFSFEVCGSRTTNSSPP